VALDDLFAERQSDARARELLVRVQALEEKKNAFGILGLDANAIVLDRKDPALIVKFARHMDLRPFAVPELDAVANQILKELNQ
jgi:3-dehydroquinate synthase class II